MVVEEIDDAIRRLDALPRHLKRWSLRGRFRRDPGANATAFDDAVHEARKSMKKARGVLRLVRDELGDDLYRLENARFRDIARRLARPRDAAVMLGTFDGLEPGDTELDEATMVAIRRALAEEVAAARADVVRWHTVGNTIDALAAARPRVASWPLDHDGWGALQPGLRRIYRQGRNRMADADADGTAEARHEWRKRAKYLWYHLRILEPVWPAALSGMVGEADRLSDLLGEDHDLAVLEAQLESLSAGADAGTLDELFARIDRQSKGLQAQAFSLGQRLYAERPADFVARVGAYFAAWRSDPMSLA